MFFLSRVFQVQNYARTADNQDILFKRDTCFQNDTALCGDEEFILLKLLFV